jgi:hypothetical protein
MRKFARAAAIVACLGWASMGLGVDGALAQAAPAKAKPVRCHDAKGKIVKCTAAGAIPATPAADAAPAPAAAPAAAPAPAPAKPSLLKSLLAKKPAAAGSAPAAEPAPTAAAPASAPAASAAPAKVSKAKAPKAAGGSASMTTAEGATAKCKDGTYWKSATHSGSCSHHGGVAAFL